MIYYITGGARSGKSSYAMRLAKTLSETPIYIATARRWDAEFENRIAIHKQDRTDEWTLLEEEKQPSKLDLRGRVAVLDCITLWLTNLFSDNLEDVETSLALFKREMDALKKADATIIVISNELGMGVHANTASGRKFVDLQGWANQYAAKIADKSVFMVSGQPLILKDE